MYRRFFFSCLVYFSDLIRHGVGFQSYDSCRHPGISCDFICAFHKCLLMTAKALQFWPLSRSSTVQNRAIISACLSTLHFWPCDFILCRFVELLRMCQQNFQAQEGPCFPEGMSDLPDMLWSSDHAHFYNQKEIWKCIVCLVCVLISLFKSLLCCLTPSKLVTLTAEFTFDSSVHSNQANVFHWEFAEWDIARNIHIGKGRIPPYWHIGERVCVDLVSEASRCGKYSRNTPGFTVVLTLPHALYLVSVVRLMVVLKLVAYFWRFIDGPQLLITVIILINTDSSMQCKCEV